MGQKSIIFQLGFQRDFGRILDLFWDDVSKVFGCISMLGLIVFQVLASSFWLRWWEISLCCFHPFGYDLVVVLCVLCHDVSHAYSCFACFDKVFALLRFGGGGGRYRCVAATLLTVILGVDCTLFVMFFTCSSMLGFRIL